jgi:hypothetical protein
MTAMATASMLALALLGNAKINTIVPICYYITQGSQGKYRNCRCHCHGSFAKRTKMTIKVSILQLASLGIAKANRIVLICYCSAQGCQSK